MATQVQFRRGTTTDISTFIGADGEVVVDTTKKTCVVHDGIQVAGYPLLREDGSNSALNVGNLSSCALKFINDPNTGIISPGADQIALVTGGASRLSIDSSGSVTIPGNLLVSGSLTSTLTLDNGSAAVPALRFTNDPDTGIYLSGTNELAISTGGTQRLTTTTTAVTSTLPVIHPLGAAATPSLTFTGDTNTGIYSPGADQVAISTGGTQRLTTDTVAVTSTLPVVHPLGAAGTPSLTFTGDLNTGLYSPGADQVAISTGGTGRLFVNSSGQIGIGTSSQNRALVVSSADSEQLVLNGTSGSLAGIFFNPNGSTYTPFFGATGESLVAQTQGLERVRIDSSGRLLVGTSSSSAVAKVVVQGITTDPNALGVIQLQVGTTTPADAIRLGRIDFTDSAGGTGVWIQAERDGGTWTSGSSHPTRLLLSTTADGASSPTERMRITSAGNVGIGTTSPGNINTTQVTSDNDGIRVQLQATPVAGQGPRLIFGHSTNNGTQQIFAAIKSLIVNGNDASWGSDLAFYTGGASLAERARIDSSGRLLVGTSTASNNLRLETSLAVVTKGATSIGGASFTNYSSTAGARSILDFQRSRATTDGSLTVVANGDDLGSVIFRGADGTQFVDAALISGQVDGTPGANDMPGRLVFSTTADGASSPTERMRISSDGDVTIGSTAIAGSRVVTVNAPSGSRASVRLDNSSQVWNTSLKGDGGQNWYMISNPAETVGVYMTPAASGWNNLSDERAKENWVDLENAVQSIKQIRTGTFSWVADKSLPRDVGLIAQDLLKVLPEAVDTSNPDQLGVRYTHVVPLLVAALKEQQEMIEALESRLAAAGI